LRFAAPLPRVVLLPRKPLLPRQAPASRNTTAGLISARRLARASSTFCLTPAIPYAWQPRGQTRSIPSAASPRVNHLKAELQTILDQSGSKYWITFE